MPARHSPILVPAALLAAAFVGGAFVGVARADDEAPSYSMEDVTACSADAMRLCRHNMPSVKAIEDCMRANYDSLRPKCQARFKNR